MACLERMEDSNVVSPDDAGYVKKPERLMDPYVKSILKVHLQINLISGQNIGHLLKGENKNNFVYIEFEVHDFAPDSENPVQKSPAVQYSLFHPVWQTQPRFDFEVKNIDSSILFLRAIEAKESLVLGRSAIPLECIREGIRAFDLLDAEHDPMIYSRLLCDVKITQHANLFNL